MQPGIFQKARFLIVDDEPQNISVLTQMLQQWEANNVISTTDPYDTVAMFQAFAPDVVLLDLMMPGLDGFAVMEQLHPLIAPDDFLPILVLTADTSDQSKRRALALGAADFLTKPFDAIELSLRLHNLLSRRLLHRRLQDQNYSLDQQVQERTRQLAQAEIDTVECLAMAAEYRDDDTGQHAQRVGHTAAQIADALELGEAQTTLIWRAAPLHDVGKIGIPDHILRKPGKLTPEEFDVIKTHSSIGAAILVRHRTTLLQLAADIALTHHERWDGQGYPQGLVGAEIPIAGRIVTVADVFDALTHERPYKKAWPLEQAIAEIQQQGGKQFDPAVIAAFSTVAQSKG
ncbi:MAG: response regulator [Abitibacteriaceae bacterium]|nr:response regulator [Abditibacteriaceae bacterium]